MARIAAIFDAQRGHLFPWLPVVYGAGIAVYFALRVEPGVPVWLAVSAVLAGLSLFILRRGAGSLPSVAIWALLAGFAVAGLRAAHVAEPVLGFRYYGPIEGRVIGIDRSASDALRLTLDRVVLGDRDQAERPARVRVSLHGDQEDFVASPGAVIMLTGHLSPPSGPVEPGGFDFRRQAFFQRLGAVGYARTPVLVYAPPRDGGLGLRIFALRHAIGQEVARILPGRAGAFAVAITTGDRSRMDRQTLEALRASNLAHLLAISGLHMGLLTGFVFAALRYGFAAVPPLALRLPVKKIAALGALGAGAAYLSLSGGNVATERAFIMVAVMFVAVLFDRRALTLRSVALAAMIVLTLRPEALTGPGFQMSFAATVALIAAFGALREVEYRRVPRWLRPVFGVVLSSAVAGLATAPVAAVHFNVVPHFGLIANVLSVPLMGTLVIPGAVIAALLAPFGLHWAGLWIMKGPIEWILTVAESVAALDGAVSAVHAPGPVVLPLVALGGLMLCLWTGRGRWLGFLPLCLAGALWTAEDRPALLISDTGGLIGILGTEGRALSKPRGDGFAAASWLENDGDMADQAEAARRVAAFPGLVHVTGRDAEARVAEACRAGIIVVTSSDYEAVGPCRVIDRRFLRENGAAMIRDAGGQDVITVRQVSGLRRWSQ